jgi:hypothetical protein
MYNQYTKMNRKTIVGLLFISCLLSSCSKKEGTIKNSISLPDEIIKEWKLLDLYSSKDESFDRELSKWSEQLKREAEKAIMEGNYNLAVAHMLALDRLGNKLDAVKIATNIILIFEENRLPSRLEKQFSDSGVNMNILKSEMARGIALAKITIKKYE